MKIVVCHSCAFDYQNQLYAPLKNSELYKQHVFIFPHDTEEQEKNSKQLIMSCDLIIAEVSFPSTGLGIELGWAESMNKKILCMHKKNTIPPSALQFTCSEFIIYTDQQTMIDEISAWVEKLPR